jgi:hypothetical protein
LHANRCHATGIKTRFATAAAIVHELIEARDERRLLRLQKQMATVELLIIDELGFVPLSKTGAELLFELVSQRYERPSRACKHALPGSGTLLSSPRTCLSTNGRPRSARNASPARFSIA